MSRRGAQPNLPPDAGTRNHLKMGRRIVRIHADGRHINHIDFRGFAGEQLQVARGRPISQEQNLPCGGKLMVGQPLLYRSFVSLPDGIEGIPGARPEGVVRWGEGGSQFS